MDTKNLKNIDNISAILTGASQVSIAVKELTDKDICLANGDMVRRAVLF